MADTPTQDTTLTSNSKPVLRPADPRFSCGPVKKYPGWSWDAIADAPLSRTHRAGAPVARIKEAIERTHALLDLPEGYKVALLPGSDTGAMEAAMWSLLGQRGTDVFSWDVFGNRWTLDARDELKLKDLRVFQTPAGELPDISQYDRERDAIFTLNGTAAGVWIPDFEWIDADREGLTLCDATSAAFAVEIDWSKIDVLTFSWQKCMGGEAQHGMLVMSPRAIERLDAWRPDWPIPGLLQLHAKGKANLAVYEGSTLNTPSLMAVEDYLAALKWASRIGGLPALIRRREENFAALDAWVRDADWVDYLCANPAHRSPVSVTLKYTDPQVIAAGVDAQWELTRKISSLLERENAALDISMHRASVPGLRIWCGPTVERDDLAALGPWLDWAYREALDAG
ncbi:phosphoserine transaminase [Maricaulis sp.]|uniref:phosphoserine transaminase n=1 Tax=Maricaulis sp. TaxID=1486257 RepID=UPI0025C596DA|nr:phosphoserine transaminase [Maricaulis sp.]